LAIKPDEPMHRRQFLTLATTAALAPVLTAPARAAALASPIVTAQLRGSISGTELGLRPGAADDQSQTLQAAINTAAENDQTLFLAAGEYLVSNISLPPRVRITGVAGETRLTYTGAGYLLVGDGGDLVRLTNLVFDGANRPLAEYVPGIVHLTDVPDAVVEGCQFMGSAQSALAFDRCGGRITGNLISGAAEAGVRAIESTGLSVTDNTVGDCGNGGILIYRWTPGEDGSLVLGNRVERIRADNGGTGQYGNGINVFQAHNVTVSQNRIADCAFTAVRANSADNVQIVGNNCSRLGEVAIFSEFAFEAAVISDNIIDTAATGISVANFNDGGRIAVVNGNVVRNLTGEGPYADDSPGFGIGINVEADAAVSGNVVEGAPLAGMWLGYGPYLRDVAVTGNIIRESPIGITVSVVEGVGAALIADNVIDGASDGAVVGMRWADRATDDLTLSGASAFPWLTINANHVVR
jgi:uncharacterized secreted repeat protein (TIGR03808 family)